MADLDAKARAHAKQEKAKQAKLEADHVWALEHHRREAVDAKTLRLRALRLAKEEEDRIRRAELAASNVGVKGRSRAAKKKASADGV
jgi:uncharacterized protein YktB (UPF0637 family)